jgi:hypothetical protein
MTGQTTFPCNIQKDERGGTPPPQAGLGSYGRSKPISDPGTVPWTRIRRWRLLGRGLGPNSKTKSQAVPLRRDWDRVALPLYSCNTATGVVKPR